MLQAIREHLPASKVKRTWKIFFKRLGCFLLILITIEGIRKQLTALCNREQVKNKIKDKKIFINFFECLECFLLFLITFDSIRGQLTLVLMHS